MFASDTFENFFLVERFLMLEEVEELCFFLVVEEATEEDAEVRVESSHLY